MPEPAKVRTRDRVALVALVTAPCELEKRARIRRADETFRDPPIVARRRDIAVEHLVRRQHLVEPPCPEMYSMLIAQHCSRIARNRS
jgi:hypothetical protein